MSRYDQLNTIVVKENDPLLSKEFQNLSNEVVAKIGTDENIFIFSIETSTEYLKYGKFTLGFDDKYSGEIKYINKGQTFDKDQGVFVKNGFFFPNEDFYIFYNKDTNIYLKTFSTKQGGLSQEILVKDGSILKKIERIKDAFFLIIEDGENKEIYDEIDSLGDGELKSLILYEKDIDKFLNERDDELYTQVLRLPFSDISEESWSCRNLVGDHGFLFIENSEVKQAYSENSINGHVFKNPGKMVLKVDDSSLDTTLSLRYSPLYTDDTYRVLIDSPLYKVTYNDEYFVLDLLDGVRTIFTKEVDFSSKEFINIHVVTSLLEDSYRIVCYVDGVETIEEVFQLGELPSSFYQNSVITLDSISEIDYLSFQTVALTSDSICDLNYGLDKKLIKNSVDKNVNVDADKINSYVVDDTEGHMLPFFPTVNSIQDIIIEVNKNIKILTTTTTSVSGMLSGSNSIETSGGSTSGCATSGCPTSGGSISGCSITDPQCLILEELPKFILNYDGTITRTDTNEMYLQSPYVDNDTPVGSIATNASISTFGGYDNWTLPSSEDLNGFFSGTISNNNTVQVITGSDVVISGGQLISNSTDFVLEDMVESGKVRTSEGEWYRWNGDLDVTELDTYIWLKREIQSEFEIRFVGTNRRIPIPDTANSVVGLPNGGIPILWRNTLYPAYKQVDFKISYTENITDNELKYPSDYKTNSSFKFKKGKYFHLYKCSKNNDLGKTVVPIYFGPETGIPQIVYADPENQLRVFENILQIFNPIPFRVELNTDTNGITIWVSLDRLGNKLPVQYGLEEEVALTNTYSKYETLERQLYGDNYYCAYHFDKLLDQRHILIKDITLDNCGEIMVCGNTETNSYLREIYKMRVIGDVNRYKSTNYRIDLDVDDVKDRGSYINNVEKVKQFITNITDRWSPSIANLTEIREKNTLIMENLLRDEFTQVLVGFTPTSNVNAYYIRSVETGQVSLLTSSANLEEEINWLGVGRIDAPYIKSGVTKIKTPSKNVKIFFETAFNSEDYRIFVFSPNNSIYYVPQKFRDGFLVESSSFVEDEVAWIALNTRNVVNGVLDWKVGVPLGDTRTNHVDRYTEINLNANRYILNLNDEGYDNFNGTDYSVILSSDSNLNLWVDNKEEGQFTIRRSYAGEDTRVYYLAVQGSSKWWENITR
jgi:hypothetical protein